MARAKMFISHKITPENLLQKTIFFTSLLFKHNLESFLKWIVTGGKKWDLYVNVVQKKK